jgi:5-methyltetrahydrofolate--homocysteine methyltransferase
MENIIDSIKNNNVLVSDGAWGTFLHKKGLQPGECPELWCATHREDVLDIAKSYIHAGSNIILTNSFGGSRFKLQHYGLDSRTTELNEAAASISREAAGTNSYVLGSIGPTGKLLMMGDTTEEELYDVFKQQAIALQRGGADALCIETMSAIDEACIAIKASKESTDLEIICTFTFEKTVSGEFRTMMGISPSEMAEAVVKAGASIIGTNCGNGMEQMIEIVREIRNTIQNIPILVHANAGKPVIRNNKTVFPETPDKMASWIPKMINEGANIIGGCCGTTPDHICAIAQTVEKIKKSV